MLIKRQLGLAGNGDGRFPHEKVRTGTSGFHSSSRRKERFVNEGGKKPEAGTSRGIKSSLGGREVRGQLASSHSSGGPGCRPE